MSQDPHVRIKEASVKLLRKCAEELIQRHVEELVPDRDRDILKGDPCWPRYEAMEQDGSLVVLVAVDEAPDTGVPEVIGYSTTILQPHPHHQGAVVATSDALYLAPERRRGDLGLLLMQGTEAAVRERGAVLMYWQAEPGSNLERVLPQMGYEAGKRVYSRRLDDG